MEQERATKGGLHTAIPGDGGYESGRVEEEVGNVQGGKEVLALTGETSADLRLLEKADVVICVTVPILPLSPPGSRSPHGSILGTMMAALLR